MPFGGMQESLKAVGWFSTDEDFHCHPDSNHIILGWAWESAQEMSTFSQSVIGRKTVIKQEQIWTITGSKLLQGAPGSTRSHAKLFQNWVFQCSHLAWREIHPFDQRSVSYYSWLSVSKLKCPYSVIIPLSRILPLSFPSQPLTPIYVCRELLRNLLWIWSNSAKHSFLSGPILAGLLIHLLSTSSPSRECYNKKKKYRLESIQTHFKHWGNKRLCSSDNTVTKLIAKQVEGSLCSSSKAFSELILFLQRWTTADFVDNLFSRWKELLSHSDNRLLRLGCHSRACKENDGLSKEPS